MQEKEFDVSYWEEVWKDISVPYEKKITHIHELHGIFSTFLPIGDLKLIEIGCAPGGWLAYFHNNFGYSVSGIEYASLAYKKTIKNLEFLNIHGEIFHQDFFNFNHEPYDLVFSSGFIEHYKVVLPVIEKIISLCKSDGGFVITIIPYMGGVNRWISKTFRPNVAAGHFPISKKELIKYHEQFGVQTIYCNYVGSLRILCPVEKNRFATKHPFVSSIINLPFRVWDRFISDFTKMTGCYPKFRPIAETVIYIGKR